MSKYKPKNKTNRRNYLRFKTRQYQLGNAKAINLLLLRGTVGVSNKDFKPIDQLKWYTI